MALEFGFNLLEEEPILARVVRCADMSLSMGPMGCGLNGDWYKSFINCQKNPAGRIGNQPVASIDRWATSCALYVRAVLYWCGKNTGIAVNASGIFTYLGNVSYAHESWTKFTAKGAEVPKPFPGAIFYVASHPQANDGHVGIFLRELEPGVWETAEGGGSAAGGLPGTTCRKSVRELKPGVRFDKWRALLGWFDPSKMGLPVSPPRPTVFTLSAAEVDDDPTPVNWGTMELPPPPPSEAPTLPKLPILPPAISVPDLDIPPPAKVPVVEPPGKTPGISLTGVALSALFAALFTAVTNLLEHCHK